MSLFNGEDQFICPAPRGGQGKKSCPEKVSYTKLSKIQIIVQRVEKRIPYNIG
jgi:hypothetical protein